MNGNYHIEPFKESHSEGALTVAEKQVGKRFIDRNWLKQFTLSKDTFGIVAMNNYCPEEQDIKVLSLREANKIAGVCFAQTIITSSLHKHILFPQEQLTRLFHTTQCVGYISLIGVDKPDQNKGIGSAMLDHISSMLLLHSKQLITVVWKATEIQKHFGVLLEKRNWKPVLNADDYWKEDSLQKKYYCAVCGDPPCRCQAVVYLKE